MISLLIEPHQTFMQPLSPSLRCISLMSIDGSNRTLDQNVEQTAAGQRKRRLYNKMHFFTATSVTRSAGAWRNASRPFHIPEMILSFATTSSSSAPSASSSFFFLLLFSLFFFLFPSARTFQMSSNSKRTRCGRLTVKLLREICHVHCCDGNFTDLRSD